LEFLIVDISTIEKGAAAPKLLTMLIHQQLKKCGRTITVANVDMLPTKEFFYFFKLQHGNKKIASRSQIKSFIFFPN